MMLMASELRSLIPYKMNMTPTSFFSHSTTSFNMKTAIVFLACILGVVLASPLETSTFPTKYDNVNVLEILKNKRLAENYFGCLKGTKKCPPDGQLLKGKFFLFFYYGI